MRQLSFVLILFLLFAGCTKKGDNPEKLTPLAEVDGDFMYQEAFRGLFTDEQWNEMSPEQRKREIENWVSLTLMAKKRMP